MLDSPDGRLEIAFHTVTKNSPSPAGGQLVYSVSFQAKPLIENSALNLELEGERPLGSNVRVVHVTPSHTDETYHLVTGKASTVRDRYNALQLDLEEPGGAGRKLVVEARAFDDAVAFRYIVPEQRALRLFRLRQERTEFRIAKDATTYSLVLPNYHTMYESEFLKLPISALGTPSGEPRGLLVGLPMLMDVPGAAWMAITEAGMRGYAAMYLVNPGGDWNGHILESRISPSLTEPDIAVSGSLPHHSPWRVLLVGAEPGRLIESNVITSLNPESGIQDTSWIHAGKSSWDWWSGSIGKNGKPAFTTENMKSYVDFSAESGFPYMLVDAGWSARNDITKMNGRVDIPALVAYAAAKNVKVWIWLH
ncbi:MAG: glycoside hydrolase family 97 N-terminal domain-containing protein, partial [Bryobacteraceae bacterium]